LCDCILQDQAEDIDLDLRRTKTEEAHPNASRAMSVVPVPRVSIPSRTSALEELVVGGTEGVGTGRQAYSRLTDDKRVIYYHELPTGTPRHYQRHYHLPAYPPPPFLSIALPSFFFLQPTGPLSFRNPVAALQTTLSLPLPIPLSLPSFPPSSPSYPSCELYSKEDPSP